MFDLRPVLLLRSEKFVRHDLNDSTDTWMTIADQEERLRDLFQAFPDFYYTIGDIIAEGDKVVVRAICHGTQNDTFMKISRWATGLIRSARSSFTGWKMEKSERWTQLDFATLFKKMRGEK